MPVFSSIQLNSDSMGREDAAYGLGKQLIGLQEYFTSRQH